VFVLLLTGCRESFIFQLVPKVCAYLYDQGFGYPKAAILVVVCPLCALIDLYIPGLKDHSMSACSLDDAFSPVPQKLFAHSVPCALSFPLKNFLNFLNFLLYFAF